MSENRTIDLYAVVYFDDEYGCNKAECDQYYDLAEAQDGAKHVNGVIVHLTRTIIDKATILEGVKNDK